MQNTDTEALGKVGVAGGELVGGNSDEDMDRTMVLDPGKFEFESKFQEDVALYCLHLVSCRVVH